jgi:hypothetical protein
MSPRPRQARQAGGHWFEPSTAHKTPGKSGVLLCDVLAQSPTIRIGSYATTAVLVRDAKPVCPRTRYGYSVTDSEHLSAADETRESDDIVDPTASRESVDALGAAVVADESLFESVFHRLSNVIPEKQIVRSVEPEELVGDALRMMAETGFSQLPVVRGIAVLGSFSYRSFAQGAAAYNGRVPLSELPVEEFLESLRRRTQPKS